MILSIFPINFYDKNFLIGTREIYSSSNPDLILFFTIKAFYILEKKNLRRNS